MCVYGASPIESPDSVDLSVFGDDYLNSRPYLGDAAALFIVDFVGAAAWMWSSSRLGLPTATPNESRHTRFRNLLSYDVIDSHYKFVCVEEWWRRQAE